MGVFISEGKPVLLQGMVSFRGRDLTEPQPLNWGYTMPAGKPAGLFYVRAGSTVNGMVNVVVQRDGRPMRFFPFAANSAVHVSLTIVEDLPAHTEITVTAAGEGSGTLILDIGFLEV